MVKTTSTTRQKKTTSKEDLKFSETSTILPHKKDRNAPRFGQDDTNNATEERQPESLPVTLLANIYGLRSFMLDGLLRTTLPMGYERKPEGIETCPV